MAANINNSSPRFDYARAERDDENSQGEAATPDGQTPPQSEIAIIASTEQQGQSSGAGAGSEDGTHDPSSTPPPPPEEATPFPAQFRYSLGEVSMGRPDYARAYPDRTPQGEREPGSRETALAPALPAENSPSPTVPVATANKPLPMPKPGSDISSVPGSLEPPAATTNAPSNSGQAVTTNNPDTRPDPDNASSNRTPYLYPGLHTAPEQSPHYANALAYGREQGYSDGEVMKLAVLMQANRDQNMGREWLALKPEVLRAAVNAVVRNPDNSFDTSGVFGGRLGFPRINSQRIPADAATAAHGFLGDGAPQYASTPPEGWVLFEETVVSPGGGGDSGDSATTTTLRYYIPRNEINVTDETAYLPLTFAGYMQVPRGYESELSVGADGGVHDLSALAFDPDYGLVMRTDNYRPYSADGNDWDRVMEIVVLGSISYGMGGAFGAILAPAGASSTAAVIGAGAAQGAFSSVVGNMLQGGDISFRGLIQSALSGGLIAGLGTLDSYRGLQRMGLDSAGNVTSYALRALSITGTSTLRGAIQALTGGSFRAGFTQAVAQGLAGEITRFLNAEITAGLSRNAITPAEATALRELSRFTGSAIRAAANPNDPMAAFAQDYLNQLLGAAEAANNSNGDINKPVDAETQQQITWMREAIDAGYEDTAAEHFNNIVALRAAENPNASRVDIANQLMRQLGMSPTGNPSLVIAPDGNMIQLSMPSLADSTAGLAAMSDTNFNRLVEGMIQAGDRDGLAALYATTRGDANAGTTIAQVGATQGISQGALSQGIRADMIRQRALDAGYDIETFPMAPRPDSPLLPGTTIAASNWRDLVNVNPIDWPDWAQDLLVRLRSTGQMVERYTSTPGQQLVQAARDWFILQATGSSTPPGGNIRPHAGLRGTSEGGVGSWERAPIRSGGVEYQEQICRVERGLEYYVEGVAFDGYDPARNVLLDSKDWRGYPPTDANFWEYKTLDEAVRQTNAARASVTQIEWVVATEQAATAIRRLFDRERIEINVVVVPKK